MKKTLFVSDLDGTLLRSNETLSEYTTNTINELVEKGLLFSYATARSYETARKVTSGLNAKIPLVVYNGAMIVDNTDGAFLLKNFFDESIKEAMADLMEHEVYPIVYGFVKGEEKFSYVWDKSSDGAKAFIESRKNGKRNHPVETTRELYEGELFYLACIDEKEKLAPFYEKYKDVYHCVFHKDVYSGDQWLEILPKEASKANAIRQLKALLECEKVIAFGDGMNDMDMFELADEAYAVANAVEPLKAIATETIDANDEDGVAKFIVQKVGNGV